MSASEHEVIRDLLADLLNEQRSTTAAIASLAVAIANAGQGSPAVQAETAKVIETAAKKASPAPKPAAQSAPAPAPTAPVEAPAASPSISYDDVAKLVIACSKANGRPFVVELLKPFGITALTGAKPDQYADIARVFEVAAV